MGLSFPLLWDRLESANGLQRELAELLHELSVHETPRLPAIVSDAALADIEQRISNLEGQER